MVKSFLLFLLSAVLPVLASQIVWEFPRLGSCHEGLAFSDGVTGILVWGGGDTINLTVGRADLWDHRGGYPWYESQNYSNIVALVQAGKKDELLGLFRQADVPANWGGRFNPYMLPLGRVVIKIPGVTLESGELDPKIGLGILSFLRDGQLMDIELAMGKESHMFVLRFPPGVEYEVKAISSMEFPAVAKVLTPRGFKAAGKWRGEGCAGFDWDLPADPSVSLSWTKCGHEVAVRTVRGERAGARSVGFGQVRKESVARWESFWKESAQVQVPDPVVQRVFEYGMYRFGAMTDPDGVPAGLQGPWLEDDRLVPWNGDYHFNINVQECYSPAYRGGHFTHLMPLFKMILSWRPLLRDNAQKFVGIDDGYVLPHSVDDRGVCIGGFWTGTIDHASTAWMASMMYRYVKYSGDTGFLKSDAYDFMKGAMRVYRVMMEERDGKLSIPLGPSPEWCGDDVKKAVGRDPSFQLAAAHRLARDLIDAAGRLGETPDPMWLDVERRLPEYNCLNGRIALFSGQEHDDSHRHHSHMAGFYPFDTIDMSNAENRKITWNTYSRWVENGTGKWTGWCVPWASILNTHVGNSVAAVEMLRCWDMYFCNLGHGSLHNAFVPGFSAWAISENFAGLSAEQVMQMDGQCAATTAVMELMAHEVNGRVEFFKGCPASWKEVSFENIRLSDGTSVSGSRVNGIVQITRH